MYLRTLETYAWSIWTLTCFFSYFNWTSMESSLKKTKVKLDLSTDIDMLLMVEQGIRGRMFHATYRYIKANNRYMKSYDVTSLLIFSL